MTFGADDVAAHLPPGMDPEAFTSAVAGSGYPLQMYAARVLKDHGFWIHEEWAYTDHEGGLRRAIDILGGRSGEAYESPSGSSSVGVELLVECKQSRHPFVFFEAIQPPSQGDHPSPIYNPGDVKLRPPGGTDAQGTQWYSSVSVGIALDIHKLPFIARTPVAASMSSARAHAKKVTMSGDEAYRELLLPLTKAMAEHRRLRLKERNDKGQPQFIDVPFLVALLDAPMFLVKGPYSIPEPVERIRMFVRAAIDPDARRWSTTRVAFVEVVRKSAFVRFLEEDLTGFMLALEQRINAHHRIVLAGEADVGGLTRGEVLDGGVLNRLIPSE